LTGVWPRVAEMNTGTVPTGSITAHKSTKLLMIVCVLDMDFGLGLAEELFAK
jgi:hypothetical protein